MPTCQQSHAATDAREPPRRATRRGLGCDAVLDVQRERAVRSESAESTHPLEAVDRDLSLLERVGELDDVFWSATLLRVAEEARDDVGVEPLDGQAIAGDLHVLDEPLEAERLALAVVGIRELIEPAKPQRSARGGASAS